MRIELPTAVGRLFGAELVAQLPALIEQVDGRSVARFTVAVAAGATVVTVDDELGLPPGTVEAAVAAVAAAHEPTAGDAEAEAPFLVEAQLRQQLTAGLAQVDAQLAILAGTPTAAQQKAALVFALRALKQLARLQLRALDAVD